jgi:hypothetical protein
MPKEVCLCYPTRVALELNLSSARSIYLHDRTSLAGIIFDSLLALLPAGALYSNIIIT